MCGHTDGQTDGRTALCHKTSINRRAYKTAKSQEAKTGIIDGYNKTEPSILPKVYHQEDAQHLRTIGISSSSESDED
jgi:hypothetical protein